jgi:hypothetical protein
MSRATETVNRECGLTASFGVGSGELLGDGISMLHKIHGQPRHNPKDGNHQEEYKRPHCASPVTKIDNAEASLEIGLCHSASPIWHKYPSVFLAEIKLKRSLTPVVRVSPLL